MCIRDRHKVFSKTELEARYEVLTDNYCKTVNIEALTMLDMARRDILPAMSEYSGTLAKTCAARVAADASDTCDYEHETLKNIAVLINSAYKQVKKLESDLLGAKSIDGITGLGRFYKDTVLADMAALRASVDSMESIAPAEKWPYPSYGELLFGVR